MADTTKLGVYEAAIRTTEAAMNETVFILYGLIPAERALVEGG